jgi:enamine deaminase RidA (YjgF/YER057c/UK114 family)
MRLIDSGPAARHSARACAGTRDGVGRERQGSIVQGSESCTDARVSVSGVGSDLALLTWRARAEDVYGDAAENAYREIAGSLLDRGFVPVQERVFCDLSAAGAVAVARARALASLRESWPVPPSFVEGSPVGRRGVAGIQVIAARGRARTVLDGERVYGTLVETGTARVLGLSDVGRWAGGRLGAGPAEDAAAAIDAAEQLLGSEGFSFRDVARTWFYLRDILDWYGPFNAVRNAAFARMGLMGANGNGSLPASTGIAGRNARGGWATLDLLAVGPRDGQQVEIKRLHNARQNEATEYGSAFARATEVALGGARYLFVSGTAAIDERGRSVHDGDFEAQTLFTLDAVQTLLRGAGASLPDVRQATAFHKHASDRPAFARILERSGLESLSLVTTAADVCRPELLFEIDATAVLPARGGRP